MNYVIVINDSGELKSVSATQLEEFYSDAIMLELALGRLLDARSAAEEADETAKADK